MAKKNSLQSSGLIASGNQLNKETNCDRLSTGVIEKRIFMVRNEQVMIDIDLANIYCIENRSLRQAVRRNIDKFPDDFLFRLNKKEANELIVSGVSQNVIPPGYNTGGKDLRSRRHFHAPRIHKMFIVRDLGGLTEGAKKKFRPGNGVFFRTEPL